MAYYLDLYGTYVRLFAKTLLQYRADLLVMIVAMIVSEGAQLLFLQIIFANIPALVGWKLHEMLLIYGLSVISGGLSVGFLNMPWRLQDYIREGTLDIVLVRSPSPLVQLIGQTGIAPWAIGRTIVGVAAVVFALQAVEARPWWALYLPLVVVSGAVLGFAVMLMVACLSFRFTNVQSVMFPVGWFGLFARYPVGIYAVPLRFVLTWVLPYAMSGFYPAAFLLRGDEYQFYGLLAPVIGFLFLGLALGVWRLALRHYHSTGS